MQMKLALNVTSVSVLFSREELVIRRVSTEALEHLYCLSLSTLALNSCLFPDVSEGAGPCVQDTPLMVSAQMFR